MSAWESAGKSDEWHTPAYIFDAMGVTFDCDVAAPKDGPKHAPCKRWISKHTIDQTWRGFVWMNPPFGGRNGLQSWIHHFIFHRDGVALFPDRTSAPWFQFVAKEMDAILFVSPKIKFERTDGTIGKSPGTGTALMAIGERGVAALTRARGLGLLVKNA